MLLTLKSRIVIKTFPINFIISYIFITFAAELRFRSSVGLEQQPSKLWVLGSNPSEITKRRVLILEFVFLFLYS